MYLVSEWFLMEIDFCRPRVINGLFLSYNFCLEIFFREAYIMIELNWIELNFVRNLIKEWLALLFADLINFFIYLGFLSLPFSNHRTEREGGGHSLTRHYHFRPLHRLLDISQAITAESSPLHIDSSWTRTGNLWFPSLSKSLLLSCSPSPQIGSLN